MHLHALLRSHIREDKFKEMHLALGMKSNERGGVP